MGFLSLLKLLKLRHIVAVLAIALAGYSIYAYGRMIELKAEGVRLKENFDNALAIDSLEVAIFKVTNESEMTQLVNQNKDLRELVRRSEIQIKRMEALYYQKQKYIDNSLSTIDVSGLVRNVRTNIAGSQKWADSSKCLQISGDLTYKNDSLYVNVRRREFNNKIALIKYRDRRKPVKWLFGLRLGKRPIKFKPEADCGEVKVRIIEKI